MSLTARRHEALYHMAHADESPNERDRARAILDAAGVGWNEPPRRPPASPPPAAPRPSPYGYGTSFTSNATGFSTTGSFFIHVVVR